MMGELNIYGVYVPPLLLWVPIALLITAIIRRALRRLGGYRLVWHRPLFELALFVIVLGCVARLASRWSLTATPFPGG